MHARMRSIASGIAVAVLSGLTGCGGANPSSPPGNAPSASSLQAVPPSRNLHLRTAFDSDPRVYVGRFIPDDVKGVEIDENRASKTTCSRHFTVKDVAVNQEMDELAFVSSSAAASLGLWTGGVAASGDVSRSSGKVVRVHYTIKRKLQVDSDPDQLAACCAKTPGDCTSRVVGEFLLGSGEIYDSTSTSLQASGSVGVPPIAARASVSDTAQWKKLQSFNDTYFAFLPVATGPVNAAAAEKAAAKDASCDFCRKLPEDAGGLYFCGVSSPVFDEAAGRDAAMQNARAQVVKYLGEQIQTKSQTLSSTAKGLVSDERFTEAFAKGLASRVKDKQYCGETENSPEHRTTFKVLAYVPNEALLEVGQKAIDEVAARKGGAVKADDTSAAKDALKRATAK